MIDRYVETIEENPYFDAEEKWYDILREQLGSVIASNNETYQQSMQRLFDSTEDGSFHMLNLFGWETHERFKGHAEELIRVGILVGSVIHPEVADLFEVILDANYKLGDHETYSANS
jgi:hypothetical protein